MSLLQMSLSGAILILVIMGIRAVAINRLPKMTFVILWEIAIMRLLIPFSFSSVTSIYTLMDQNVVGSVLEEISDGKWSDASDMISGADLGGVSDTVSGTESDESADIASGTDLGGASDSDMISGANTDGFSDSASEITLLPVSNAENEDSWFRPFSSLSLWTVIRLTGTLLGIAFFVISYERSRLKFSFSLPVQNEFVERWLGENWHGRPVSVRQSDQILAPLTYGIVRPVILMPKEMDWTDTGGLKYILTHECMHIRRYDAVKKLVCVLALCVHWFNPLVWVMYFFFNRDIELACDERVIRFFGETSRKEYSMVLIGMEAKKSGLVPFYNHFSKDSVEERIASIMKTKKMTAGLAAVSLVIVAAVIALFVTSPKEGEGSSTISAVDASESPVDSDDDLAAFDDESGNFEGAQTGQSAEETQVYQTITVDGLEVSIKDLEEETSWQITVKDPETGQETKVLELEKLTSSGVILQRVGELMGMQSFLVFYTTQEGFCITRYYFGILDGECLPLGEGGGYGDADEYILDVDGDGVTELICNQLYSDGVQSALIYQWDGEKVLVGSLEDLLTEEPDSYWFGSFASWYLPQENVVEITYWKDEESHTARYEIDLSRVEMYEYD